MTITIGLLLYDDVQPMDVMGPWEVLSMWKNVLKASVQLHLISENGSYVQCDDDILLKAHCDFSHAPKLDYLIVPGGKGRRVQVENERLIAFIKEQAQHAKLVISVCTGMFLLQKAGLLHGKSVTTYWRALPEARSLPNLHLVPERIVKSGNIWTGAGISSGIDLALALIAEIVGEKTAGEVQWIFEYFPDGKVYGSKETAKELPPYFHEKEPTPLPAYVENFIKKKS